MVLPSVRALGAAHPVRHHRCRGCACLPLEDTQTLVLALAPLLQPVHEQEQEAGEQRADQRDEHEQQSSDQNSEVGVDAE